MTQLDNVSKQALRLAAVGALLHNLGKIHGKFLDKQINSGSNDYLYQHILGLIAPHVGNLYADWQANYSGSKLSTSAILDMKTVNALAHTFSLPEPLNDRTDYTSGDLIEYLGQGEPWYSNETGKFGIECLFSGGSRLTHLMNRAHRGASGGEKEDIATAQQPDPSDLYLSTPFGYETAAPNINTINNLLQQIETVIQRYLLSPTDPLLLADLISDLRPLLSQAIADTQRPLNDVTIGDIGHTGMAFLLTQAVEWILTGRTIGHDELAKEEEDNALLWRVLTIHANSLRYLEEAASLADLSVRKNQLQDAFQKVSHKLAEILLAVEIYADEQRRLFLFPNLAPTHSVYQTVIQAIRGDLNMDGLCLHPTLSEPMTNHPKDKDATDTTRRNVYIGEQVVAQLQTEPPYAFAPETIAAFWQKQPGQKQSQICTACNLRPQGYGAEQVDAYKYNPVYYREKAEKRSLCCVCMDRRAGVAQKWAERELSTTVWLDEVADENGRLALIVGQWDLATFIKSFSYPKAKKGIKEKTEPDFFRRLDQPSPWVRFVNLTGAPMPTQIQIGRSPRVTYEQNGLGWFVGEQGSSLPNKFKSPTFPQLNLSVDNIYLENGEYFIRLVSPHNHSGHIQLMGQRFEAVDDHTLKTVDVNGRNRIANLFLHNDQFIVDGCLQVYPTAPNPSFARIRRIWQTTQTFWQTVFDEPNSKGESLIPAVAHRLQIIPANRNALSLGHYHTYDLKLTDSVKLSVVWDTDNKRFITCDNLAYSKEQLGAPVIDFLKGELTLEEPTGYGSQNKTWGKITVEQASIMPNSAYATTIPILAEPRTFMALVPADKALDVIDAIKTKYEREMGKVRNRLPLHLGAVYFHRRTPLRTALDAGRRMLKYEGSKMKEEDGKMKEEIWIVQQDAQTGPLPAEQKRLQAEEKGQFTQTILVQLQQADRSFTWHLPNVMGDGLTPDNWYPYVFFQQDSAGNGEPTGRSRIFKGLRPQSDGSTVECWLVHAHELQQGDGVYFTPATFDFEWLDNSAQRFTIAYDPQTGQRRANPAWPNPTRPYLLDDLATMQRVWQIISDKDGLTNSQIYALRDLVEAKREEWGTGETFDQLCRDAVVNAQWENRQAIDLNLIAAAAQSGLLTDIIQLYMGIMKAKPHRAEEDA